MAGLADVAGKKVGGFSLGMHQRLGIASALLGDPPVLLFDEPVNGLDPEGILWIRALLMRFASEGRTVFISSHLMSEMEQTADHLVIIGRGRLIADASIREVLRGEGARRKVRVRTPSVDELAGALLRRRLRVHPAGDGELLVEGASAETVGDVALEEGVAVHRLAEEHDSLEQVYLDLTGDSVQYRVAGAPEPAGLVRR